MDSHRGHGRRGRWTEYSIGWPLDARTQGAIDQVPEQAWTARLAADGRPEPAAQVAELTALLCHGPDGDLLEGWTAGRMICG